MVPAPSSDAARPQPACRRRFWLPALLILLPLLALTISPAGAQSVIDPDLDSDGDGIVNAFDPDDDNDGVPDDRDPAPFDPAIPGGPLPPSSIDPDTDSDGDGIANSHDPDDDNDGAVDATDPVVFDPDNTPPEPSGPGGGSGGGASSAVPGGSGGTASRSTSRSGSKAVVVTGLPKTGAGTRDAQAADATHLLAIGAAAAIMLMLAGLQAVSREVFRRPAVIRRQWSPVQRR